MLAVGEGEMQQFDANKMICRGFDLFLSRILVDQIRAVDKRRLSLQIFMCGRGTIIALDKALKLVLNLELIRKLFWIIL